MTLGRTFALVGITSSGKSTLANLIAGRFLLPNEQTESARIALEIAHSPHTGTQIDVASRSPSDRLLHLLDEHLRERVIAARKRLLREAIDPSSQSQSLIIRTPFQHIAPIAHPLTTMLKRLRTHLLGEPLIPLVPQFAAGPLIVRDLPGFLHQGDHSAQTMIRAGIAEAQVVYVINALEVDPHKEVALLRSVLQSLAEVGQDERAMIFVINRIDLLISPHEQLNERPRRMAEVAALIAQAIRDVFGSTARPLPALYPLAALPALTAVLLSGSPRHLSTADRDYLLRMAANFVGTMLPESMDDYPRDHRRWDRSHLRNYAIAMTAESGWQSLHAALASRWSSQAASATIESETDVLTEAGHGGTSQSDLCEDREIVRAGR